MHNIFHKSCQVLITKILEEVMNSQVVLQSCIRQLSMYRLISSIQHLKTNYLVIGKTYSFLINCATVHPNYFLGTKRMIPLPSNSRDKLLWGRLESLIQKYASCGSTILVYHLHGLSVSTKPIG